MENAIKLVAMSVAGLAVGFIGGEVKHRRKVFKEMNKMDRRIQTYTEYGFTDEVMKQLLLDEIAFVNQAIK